MNVQFLLTLTEASPVAQRRMDDTYPIDGFNEFHEPSVTKPAQPRAYRRMMLSLWRINAMNSRPDSERSRL